MPCFGTTRSDELAIEARQADTERLTKALRDLNLVEALLCGVLTVLEGHRALPEVLKKVDYKEGGFTEAELVSWWEKHKLEDKERRHREKQAKERKAQEVKASINKRKLKDSALKKLTKEERKALGL